MIPYDDVDDAVRIANDSRLRPRRVGVDRRPRRRPRRRPPRAHGLVRHQQLRPRHQRRRSAGSSRRASAASGAKKASPTSSNSSRFRGNCVGALDNKVAIVTGAGRGIGRGEALALAAAGASVVVNDFEQSMAQAVVDEITAAGGKAIANGSDVASWAGAEAMIDQAVDDVRWPRRVGQQRWVPPRPDQLQHDRGELGRGDQRPPQGSLRAVAVRVCVLAQPVQGGRRIGRCDRQHRQRSRPLRRHRPGQLRRRQGRHRRAHHRHGPRDEEEQRAGQRASRREHAPA